MNIAASSLAPPTVLFRDRVWSSADLTEMAVVWLDEIRATIPAGAPLVAMVLANDPESVALFFALSSLPVPLILLPPDPAAWRTAPSLPTGSTKARLLLVPSAARLDVPARDLGFVVHVLPDRRGSGGAIAVPDFLSAPGVVVFSSGSTGPPKPIYRTMAGFVNQARAIVRVHGLGAGANVLGALPLAGGYGLENALMVATVVRGTLGLLGRFEHRAFFDLLAGMDYDFWAGTPLMADILARCALAGPTPRLPAACAIGSGRLSRTVFEAFRERFGQPLRPSFGLTESGVVAASDGSPEALARPESVGRAVPGVEIRIGVDPAAPHPPGQPGRIWFTSPFYMEGYGFPPAIARTESRNGWWPTPDIGVLDEAQYLTVLGRTDDRFKTTMGHLIDPADIARALGTHPAVIDTAVVPLAGPHGPAFGVIIQADPAPSLAELRARIAASLPLTCQPEIMHVVPELPRLPGGKVDHRACVAILEHRLRKENLS